MEGTLNELPTSSSLKY